MRTLPPALRAAAGQAGPAGMSDTPRRQNRGVPQVLSLRFSTAARLLSAEARRHGLVVPGFKSPPRIPGADRTIRRFPEGGAVIAVRLRERPFEAVLADMVEGLLVANALAPAAAQHWRARLLEAATVAADRAA